MDEHAELRSGDRVTLVRAGDGAEPWRFDATVASHDGTRVEVILDGAGAASVVGVEETVPLGAHAPVADFGAWQRAANRRASSRYPTYRPCQLIEGGAAVDGHVLDLSIHGVAVEAIDWSGERFALRVDSSCGAVDIPCATVGVQQTAVAMVIVHARFMDLTAAQKTAVVELSESVRADFAAAQSRLVKPFRRLQANRLIPR